LPKPKPQKKENAYVDYHPHNKIKFSSDSSRKRPKKPKNQKPPSTIITEVISNPNIANYKNGAEGGI
jgi:hypothetical protein